ncbi:MAG: DUF6470 family protein [Sedimentibacter sp.]
MIGPLIEIKTVPMSMEFKINKARFEIASSDASFELTRENGGLQMKMNPAKMNIDTVDARYSTSVKSAMISVNNGAEKGIKASYNATASYAEDGNLTLNVNFTDNPISEIAMRKFLSDVNFNNDFTTSVGQNISFESGELSINFQMDKSDFDWSVTRPEFNFIPGSIELIVNEYPRVEINYTGTPLFVPRSSDPNYKPIDTII